MEADRRKKEGAARVGTPKGALDSRRKTKVSADDIYDLIHALLEEFAHRPSNYIYILVLLDLEFSSWPSRSFIKRD